MRTLTFSILLLLLFFTTFLQAQRSKINDLTEETQLLSNDDDKMRLVWWVPNEFWTTAFESEESMSQEDIDGFISIFNDYTVFAIADGEISDYGSVNYIDKASIINSTYISKDGIEIHPLMDEEVTGDAKIVLGMLKPVLSNMLGNMGENIHFILFPGYDKKDNRLIDPSEDDDFSVSVGGELFSFNLPLGALMPPKTCKKHSDVLNGAWNYCPYCGNELILVEE